MRLKSWKTIIISILALLVMAGCGAANDQAEEPDQAAEENQAEQPAEEGAEAGDIDAAAAEQAYQANCLACHGANLEGTVGPGLTDVGARLSQDEILNIIQNGKNTMPAQTQLSDEEAQNMAAWLGAKK